MFDTKAFMKQQFQPRTAEVDVAGLSDFFGKDEKLVWIVRGQTASEMARAFESASSQKNINSIISAIGNSSEQIAELKKTIGLSDETPEDIIKRLEQLVSCSITPKIDLPCAVKLAETFPVEFYILTNEITKLTGLGMEAAVKKPVSSGKTKK